MDSSKPFLDSDPRSDEWEQTVRDFQTIQADLAYQQAQSVLHNLIQRLDLSTRERVGLETDIASLEGLLTKLEEGVIHIAVFGMVGRGKSSILNALLGHSIFETGPLHGVTQQVERADWVIQQGEIPLEAGYSAHRVSLQGSGQSRVELIDTPGIDEVAGEEREAIARSLARQVDLILFVISGDMARVEYEALTQLHATGKPIVLVLNKVDQYAEADRQLIYDRLRHDRLQGLIDPDAIVMAAASPLVRTATRGPDGRLIVQHQRGAPQVTELKLKLLDILHQEGKSLVALNTMLYADGLNEEVVQKKMAIRDRIAEDLIWRAVMAKAGAIAINPVTVLDLLGGAIVDVILILALSRLYGIPMTQAGAVNLLQKIALELGGLSASDLLLNLGLSSLKGMLGLSAPITAGVTLPPYVAVAITQAGVAGVSTYGIGQVTKTYLGNGATWGVEGPKAVIRNILNTLDETSILNRIRQDLMVRLGETEAVGETESAHASDTSTQPCPGQP